MSIRTSGRCAAVFLFLVVLAVPAPAAAGGWWSFIELESTYLAPGMRVEAADSGLSFTSTKEAERARRTGRYYVYLIEGLDLDTVKDQMLRADPRRGWWALGDAMALRAGRVSLRGWHANLARAHARFVTPDLRPGIYTVMFCDAGCRHPLGDAIPSKVRVVADPPVGRSSWSAPEPANRLCVGRLTQNSIARTPVTVRAAWLPPSVRPGPMRSASLETAPPPRNSLTRTRNVVVCRPTGAAPNSL